MVVRKLAAIFALLAALVVTQGQSIPTVVAPFQMFSPGPGPSVAIPAGAQACTIVDNLPPAYAFFTPQQSNDTFTWTPLTTVGGGNITQPGVYVGSPSKLYFRPFLTQVNFPGVTGYELCGANALGLLAPVFPFESTTLTNLTVTSLTATSITTTNFTQTGQTGCAQFAAGVLTGTGITCAATAATPSPTASGCIVITGTYPYTISCSTPTPLPSPVSGNGNCVWTGLSIACTTPTPLPSPTAVATGCGTATWTGLSLSVNTTGCQVNPPVNQKYTVQLIPAGCTTNAWCQCKTSPSGGETACTASGSADAAQYLALPGHFECFGIAALTGTNDANFGIVIQVINANSFTSGNEFPFRNETGANLSGNSDVAMYITCLV